MTHDVPFTVSASAEAYFREALGDGASIPETVGLVPALCYGRYMTTWALRGRAIPEYTAQVYSVGYYRPDQVAGWPRVRVAGADLAVHPETLAGLRGLHLELEPGTAGQPFSGGVVGRRY